MPHLITHSRISRSCEVALGRCTCWCHTSGKAQAGSELPEGAGHGAVLRQTGWLLKSQSELLCGSQPGNSIV